MIQPRYPVYVPTKGRWERPLTIKALRCDDVPFHAVVEPQEVERYASVVGGDGRLLVLPLRDRGLFETRNWIRDHSAEQGHARHWQIDDNINGFRRLYGGRRIPCHAGVALRVCEDFTDRFENVAISGLNYQMFVPAETPVPYYRNVHVYSCTLINHAAPHRWRLVYNDDTDLCLQALVGGWCTVLLNAFMANKMRTMAIKGGNTNQLYAIDGDADALPAEGTASYGRFAMARVLERTWPGLVKTRLRFGRYQHSVDWKQFRTPLRLRRDVDLLEYPLIDEYDLRLREVKRPKAESLRALAAEFGSRDS